MIVSRAQRSDANHLARIMFDAVRDGATLYSVAERRAWVPHQKGAKDFAKIIRSHEVWVARSVQGPVGFIGLKPDGYVNLIFILRHARGKGVFGRLLSCVDNRARTVHASLHAEPAFAAHGFQVVHRELVPRLGQLLRRAYMARP
ncbi:MAG: GNAT family N-acetyltransferase [Paracoccaceae bacterium]